MFSRVRPAPDHPHWPGWRGPTDPSRWWLRRLRVRSKRCVLCTEHDGSLRIHAKNDDFSIRINAVRTKRCGFVMKTMDFTRINAKNDGLLRISAKTDEFQIKINAKNDGFHGKS